MPDVEICPFSDEHLDDAAALLRDRHERHLAAEPLLAHDVDYRAQLAGQQGVVAVRNGELRAYLLGQTTDTDAFVRAYQSSHLGDAQPGRGHAMGRSDGDLGSGSPS